MSGHNPTEFAATSLFNVEGWTVLVTGGGTGIGLMIAQAFANNGARVYIVGRRSEVLLKSAETWGAKLANSEGQLIPLTADINSKELVNNAGVHLETSNTGGIRAESPEALKEFLWDHSWDDIYKDTSLRRSRSSLCSPRPNDLTTLRVLSMCRLSPESLAQPGIALCIASQKLLPSTSTLSWLKNYENPYCFP